MRSFLLFGMLMALLLSGVLEATPSLAQEGGSPGYGRPVTDPFVLLKPLSPAWEPLPFSSVRPTGWLKVQIQENLAGFTGHLDSLCPVLVVKDDIYGKDRLTRKVHKKEVGALTDNDAALVQYLWWNSETQSNWWDGFLRSAILVGDSDALAKAEAYVRRILRTQDSDGYLGIYDRDLRYHFRDENGELWSKTTLLRGLLAWYEYSRDPSVLQAVEKATLNVMKGYPPDTSRPFYSIHPNVGGLSHGLVFTDVLETLYRLTGKREYQEYIVFLYRNFSTEVLNEDAQYAKLMDSTYQLKGHGVHTYEHIRALAAAAYASGNPMLDNALDQFLVKVSREINPSGGPAGDEWIGGRPADPTLTGYEYCSLQELLHSYTDLLAKTGHKEWGDKTERLFFNAAQGAVDAQHRCIAYLKTDNSYYMTGPQNGDSTQHHQTRYSYSPVHQDAAVCCVPNAGRIAPYYVASMWMKNGDALAATLLGPSTVRTVYKGDSVCISEHTEYPYGGRVDFVVDKAPGGSFSLCIRMPEWVTRPVISVNGRPDTIEDRFAFMVVRRVWTKGDIVRLDLDPKMEVTHDRKGQPYFTYGPLVLAHPIPSTFTVTKNYPLAGFHDYAYRPDSLLRYVYKGGAYGVFPWAKETAINGGSAQRFPEFQALMTDPVSGRDEQVSLVPMGKTILRQVTF